MSCSLPEDLCLEVPGAPTKGPPFQQARPHIVKAMPCRGRIDGVSIASLVTQTTCLMRRRQSGQEPPPLWRGFMNMARRTQLVQMSPCLQGSITALAGSAKQIWHMGGSEDGPSSGGCSERHRGRRGSWLAPAKVSELLSGSGAAWTTKRSLSGSCRTLYQLCLFFGGACVGLGWLQPRKTSHVQMDRTALAKRDVKPAQQPSPGEGLDSAASKVSARVNRGSVN